MGKYLLNIETEHRVSKTCVNKIAVSNQEVLNSVVSNLQTKVMSCLGDSLPPEKLGEVLDLFQKEKKNTSDSFDTAQKRQSYYKRHFHYIPPKKMYMGSSYLKTYQGRTILKKCFCYVVPLEDLLKSLLELEEIFKFVTQPLLPSSGTLHDICDGEYVQNHPLSFGKDPFLQFILSFDDLEIQNPLRSSQLHKMSMFYFTLANIPTKFRSKLHNIFLLGVAKSKDIKKFGLSSILKDFLSTISKLK